LDTLEGAMELNIIKLHTNLDLISLSLSLSVYI